MPFRIYRVEVRNRGRLDVTLLGADAVTGTLDPYAFEQLPVADELVALSADNVLPARLDGATGARLLEDKVRRIMYQWGFFRLRRLEVGARPLPVEVHVPYWLGVSGTDARVRLRVLDATRGRIEGSRARALFEDWLLDRLPAPPG